MTLTICLPRKAKEYVTVTLHGSILQAVPVKWVVPMRNV